MARVVLVVDDEPFLLDLTSEMLEELGCEVVTARDGYEALVKLVDDRRISVLITDINMPGMDGYELVWRAKLMREDLSVIGLSGRAWDGFGFPIIRKPFNQADLINTMRETTGLC